jgi:copper homeostasis protein
VLEGASAIASLVRQAGNRLTIMAGGGLSLANISEVIRLTGASYFHGSLARKASRQAAANRLPSHHVPHHAADDAAPIGTVHAEDVREAIRLMHQAAETQLAL